MRDHASDSVVRPDVDDVDESADSGPCLVHGSLSDVVPSVLGSWGSQSEITCPDGESNLDGGVCESFGYRSVSSSVSRLVSTRTVRRPSVLSRPSPRSSRVAGVGGPVTGHGGSRSELQVVESSSLDDVSAAGAAAVVASGAGLSPRAAEFRPRKYFNRPIVTYPLCPPLPPGPEPTGALDDQIVDGAEVGAGLTAGAVAAARAALVASSGRGAQVRGAARAAASPPPKENKKR